LAQQVGSNADKLAVRPKQVKCRSRPLAAVHSLDRMIFHRSDSGHSFQVQQSHGSEGRFIAGIQTRFQGAVSAYF
jgi:hypothetical protein